MAQGPAPGMGVAGEVRERRAITLLGWLRAVGRRRFAAMDRQECRSLRLARISHRLTGQAHEGPAITSLRLLAVLNGLREYASARQAARASY